MANPQREDGHVDIANELVEALARVNLSAYEWRVLMVVLRKTYGWHRKEDVIPLSQIAGMTGLSKPHICHAKKRLLTKKLLRESHRRLGFQKDYDQWVIAGSGNVASTGNDVASTGNKSLPLQAPSKERGKKLIQKKGARAPARPPTPAPYKPFLDLWASKGNLPGIQNFSRCRQDKFRRRMKERLFADRWQEIIEKLSQSAFCTGKNDRGWKADIDWLLKDDANYVKVLEGKYDKTEADLDAEDPMRYLTHPATEEELTRRGL